MIDQCDKPTPTSLTIRDKRKIILIHFNMLLHMQYPVYIKSPNLNYLKAQDLAKKMFPKDVLILGLLLHALYY